MKCIPAIAINPAGTLAAYLSLDNCSTIRLWQISDSRTIAVLKLRCQLQCITFSIDGGHILGGTDDNRVLEFAIHKLPMKSALVKDASNKHASEVLSA
jgi:WD40 repeat protein